MVRYFPSVLVLLVSLCCLPGCAPSGGEAEFVPSASQTPEELQEEEEYNKMMEEQSRTFE